MARPKTIAVGPAVSSSPDEPDLGDFPEGEAADTAVSDVGEDSVVTVVKAMAGLEEGPPGFAPEANGCTPEETGAGARCLGGAAA